MNPRTENEAILLAALRESQEEVAFFKNQVIHLQAAAIINNVHCRKLQAQLYAKLKSKNQKGKRRLLGDGLPRLLSGDKFYEEVVAANDQQE